MQTTELSFSALARGSVHQVVHGAARVIVVRSEDDRIFAFHDKCPHAFWPLSQGTLRNGVLECPGHGWEFDLTTGRCLTAPVYCLTPVHATLDGDLLRLQWPDDLSTVLAEGAGCSANPGVATPVALAAAVGSSHASPVVTKRVARPSLGAVACD